MGLLLSKNGIGPTEEKVRQDKAADPVRKLARKGEPLFVVKSRSYLKN